MNITVLNRQTILDIAVQEYGNVEAAFYIALANDLSVADDVGAAVLVLPAGDSAGNASRLPIVNYYKNRGIRPATAITDDDGGAGVFDKTFDYTFN
jgi:hypothetical protein